MSARWLTGIGAGWHELVRPLIARCEAEGVEILQVKEKFGGLRFYVNGANKELYAAIDAAETASVMMCEVCGQLGKPRNIGRIKTLCSAHAGERK